MKKLTIIFMIVATIAAIAKYSIVPVIATNETINNNVWCVDRHGEAYLVEDIAPNKGYTLVIDRHNIFNSEDNEILRVIH